MRYTHAQFNKEFPTEEACLQRVFDNRYGNLEYCPKCGVIDPKFYRVKKRKCYACKDCGHQLHPLAQTIFHKSETPLKSWFYAIYLFSVSKNGVSAKEIERHLGVTYKTAHRMAMQIHKLMTDVAEPLSGDIEIDESYIGGHRKLAHKFANKSVVFGMVERGGSAKIRHVKSSGSRVLLPIIVKEVKPNSRINSDEWTAYKTLSKRGFTHATVNHSHLEYVRGTTHTNTIEGYWSNLKTSLSGTYHSVSPKYLQAYLDEFSFRYNFRGLSVFRVLLERASMPFVLSG